MPLFCYQKATGHKTHKRHKTQRGRQGFSHRRCRASPPRSRWSWAARRTAAAALSSTCNSPPCRLNTSAQRRSEESARSVLSGTRSSVHSRVHGDPVLSARSLLALLEECNPDSSNDRADYGRVAGAGGGREEDVASLRRDVVVQVLSDVGTIGADALLQRR